MFAKSDRYSLIHRISAHKRGIYTLALLDTGKLLASEDVHLDFFHDR